MNWDVIQIGMELNVEEGYFGEDIKPNFSNFGGGAVSN